MGSIRPSILLASASFLLVAMLAGCNGCNKAPESELAYLWKEKGKYPRREGVLDSQPLQKRLEALLMNRYGTFVKNWDAEGPLDPKESTLFASACVSHFCDEHGSAFYIDLSRDELMAFIRIRDKVEMFREKAEQGMDVPAEAKEWIGRGELAVGDTGPEAPAPESSGSFEWMAWADAPMELKNEMKGIKIGGGQTAFKEAQEAADEPCDVQVARYDLDGDGKPGIIVTYQCAFWCGQLGCAFKAYESGKSIDLVDEVEAVRPGDGGVISSKGVLLKLE